LELKDGVMLHAQLGEHLESVKDLPLFVKVFSESATLDDPLVDHASP
jgi:hypothetical protein